MKNQRIKQISLSLCFVLSLLVSSVSACVCTHHQEFESVKTSCHEHPEMQMTEMSPDSDDAQISQNNFSERINCSCFQPAPKVFSNAEIHKVEKQAARNFLVIEFEFEAIPQIAAAAKTDFSKPFYLSDSFYNIKSPRAPPSF
jgi:hypothetical protein